MFFDTHCHLDFPQFDARRDAVLESCARAGIGRILIPGVTAKGWARLIQLCRQRGKAVDLKAALGLHPMFMEQHRETDLEQLRQLLEKRTPEVVAVGEIGLDYLLPPASWPEQQQLLRRQLKLAATASLPVVLHVRKAHDQVLKILRELNFTRGGVVHAFSGSEQQALRYRERGFLLGVGGAISWPRATRLRGLMSQLPLEALVLETDAPDMKPSFAEGQWNSPVHLPGIAGCLAELKNVSVEQIAEQTLRNMLSLLYADE
ncbi:TatD family hydrolase [Aestuariirhabdus litorea]|nr:TatD family hydrolase [Aestuariirhabdus litorea]